MLSVSGMLAPLEKVGRAATSLRSRSRAGVQQLLEIVLWTLELLPIL